MIAVGAVITAISGWLGWKSLHRTNTLQAQLSFIQAENERILQNWVELANTNKKNYEDEVKRRIELEVQVREEVKKRTELEAKLATALRRIEALEQTLRRERKESEDY